MKKSVIFVLILLAVSILTSCTKENTPDSDNVAGTGEQDIQEPASQSDQITGSINEAESIDSEVSIEEVDSELEELDKALENW